MSRGPTSVFVRAAGLLASPGDVLLTFMWCFCGAANSLAADVHLRPAEGQILLLKEALGRNIY